MATLIDTTALVALLDGRHPEHELTRHMFAYELDAADRLIVTNYVALETVDVLRRRLGVAAVTTFLRDLLPAFDVEWVRPVEHELAVERLIGELNTAGAERQPSLVDCATFLVARRLGVGHCLAIDERFDLEGL